MAHGKPGKVNVKISWFWGVHPAKLRGGAISAHPFISTLRSQECTVTPSFSLMKCDHLALTQPFVQRQQMWHKTRECWHISHIYSRLQSNGVWFFPCLWVLSHHSVPQSSSECSLCKHWPILGTSSWPRQPPAEPQQADAAKVLAHPPRWAEHPRHLRGTMTMQEFSLPDERAQPGLGKLLVNFQCMLCFSMENCGSLGFLFVCF